MPRTIVHMVSRARFQTLEWTHLESIIHQGPTASLVVSKCPCSSTVRITVVSEQRCGGKENKHVWLVCVSHVKIQTLQWSSRALGPLIFASVFSASLEMLISKGHLMTKVTIMNITAFVTWEYVLVIPQTGVFTESHNLGKISWASSVTAISCLNLLTMSW